MRRLRPQIITQVLIVTALFAALGTDCLAQAGISMRADAVVSVAEQMAARLTRALEKKQQEHRSAVQNHAQSMMSTASCSPILPPRGLIPHVHRPSAHVLNLPPPLA